MKLILILVMVFVSQAMAEKVIAKWTRTYNDAANGDDRASGVAADTSGNVYVTGYITGAGKDIWLRKYDASGNVVWTQTYNGTGNGDDIGSGVAVDSSGNVYVVGSVKTGTNSNIWLRKYDPNGTELWTREYDGASNGNDYGKAIAIDNQGNVNITGSEWVSGQGDNIWVRGYDPSGTVVWTRTYNDATNGNDVGRGIATDMDGNVYVTGSVAGTGQDIWIGKYSGGFPCWTKSFDISGSDDCGYGIAVDGSYNIYVVGTITQSGSTFLYRGSYSPNGIPLESTTYSGGDGNTAGYSMLLFHDTYIYVAGYETKTGGGTNTLVIKYPMSGEPIWVQTYNGTSNGDDVAMSIFVDSGENVYTAGYTTVSGQNSNIWVRKYLQGAAAEGEIIFLFDGLDCKIVGNKNGYVNPAAGEKVNFFYRTTEPGVVTFKVYNLRGELVKTLTANSTASEDPDRYEWNCLNESEEVIASGIYVVKTEGPGLNVVKKFAIIK